MPTRFIKRSTGLDGGQTSKANAAAIYMDSDNDILTYTTGASGTTEEQIVGRTLTQTLTNKTFTAPVVTGDFTFTRKVSIVTTNQTLVAADSGTVYIANAADLVFTLPATAAGLEYTIVNAAVSAATGLSFSPVAADAINEGVDNKDLINSGATDVLGDSVTLVGDGSTGWYTTSKIGTWAAEA